MGKHRKSAKIDSSAQGIAKIARSGNPAPLTTASPPTAGTAPHLPEEEAPKTAFVDLYQQKGFWYIMIACFIVCWSVGVVVGVFFPNKDDFDYKQRLADGVRATGTYKLITFDREQWGKGLEDFIIWIAKVEQNIEADHLAKNPSHPRLFSVLREAIIREDGGFVHHDLGFLVPAPCGASRGIGFVRDSFNDCQTRCFPGSDKEAKEYKEKLEHLRAKNETLPVPGRGQFEQIEVLIRVPLSYQMTRSVALNTLKSTIPTEVQATAPLDDLDDAALLVLLLAHERGYGRYSRWLPYISTLPLVPSCGFSKALRPYMFDMILALGKDLGLEVRDWSVELEKAGKYADKIAKGLNEDYGSHIKSPEGVSSLENIEWALCQVTSRATAGNKKFGGLRLVPMIDIINHDVSAGGFVELSGKEKTSDGDFLDANEDDAGTFVVRSLRHGKRKILRENQELLANYNVPHYTPFDWFTSLGFVPRERWTKWKKIEPGFPPLRRDLTA